MNLNSVSQNLRLREYYFAFCRHQKWFYISLVFCFCVSTALTFVLPKVYRAETVLLVEDEKILNPLISGLAVSPSVKARMSTLKAKLLSWERLTLLVEKLGLHKKAVSPAEHERLIQTLRDNIEIKMDRSNLITVSFDGPDPRKAQEVVQTLGDIIIEGNITSVNLEANSAIRFINSQLDYYRENLEKSENNLREFQEVYNSILPIATRLNETLVDLHLELSSLLTENTEEHPRVIQTRQTILQVEKQRDELYKQVQDLGLELDEEEYSKMLSSVPLQQQKLAKLRRDYAVNNTLYQRLLEKLETAKISQTLEESDSGTKFKILEAARLPLSPIKPNKTLFVIGGLFLGSGLGALIIFLLEMNNNSIRNIEEAKQLFEMPILGVIGKIEPAKIILHEEPGVLSHV